MSIEEDVEVVRQWCDTDVERALVDRIVAYIRLLEFAEPKEYASANRLRKERDELREVLHKVATLTWNPAIGLPATPDSDLHNIARAALKRTEEEVIATPNRP